MVEYETPLIIEDAELKPEPIEIMEGTNDWNLLYR